MNTYVIRRRSGWKNSQDLERAATISARIGNDEMPDKVRWIRSYVVNEPNGELGTVCIYQATDPEAIREHARRVGMPADEISLVQATVIVREDPKPETIHPARAAPHRASSAARAARGLPGASDDCLRSIWAPGTFRLMAIARSRPVDHRDPTHVRLHDASHVLHNTAAPPRPARGFGMRPARSVEGMNVSFAKA